MNTYDLFGPVDELLGANVTEEILVIELVLLGLILVNMAARAFAYRGYARQGREEGAEGMSRSPIHVVSNILLVLGAFYYLTLQHHAGIVASMIVIGVVLTDIFEFEARKVEARREIEFERPKAAISGTVLALIYVSYVTFFSGPIGGFL